MTTPTRYRDWYQGMPDSFAGQKSTFNGGVLPENDTAPATLRDTVLNSGSEIPKVFAALTRRARRRATDCDPTRPTSTSSTAQLADQLNDQAFACERRGPGNQVSLVLWPLDLFIRSAARVPTHEAYRLVARPP
jgi:hypothetical protein